MLTAMFLAALILITVHSQETEETITYTVRLRGAGENWCFALQQGFFEMTLQKKKILHAIQSSLSLNARCKISCSYAETVKAEVYRTEQNGLQLSALKSKLWAEFDELNKIRKLNFLCFNPFS